MYKALAGVVKSIENTVGIVVMPNGGDIFVRRFVQENPGLLKAVVQEGVVYEDNKKTSSSDQKYLTNYLDWCKNRESTSEESSTLIQRQAPRQLLIIMRHMAGRKFTSADTKT